MFATRLDATVAAGRTADSVRLAVGDEPLLSGGIVREQLEESAVGDTLAVCSPASLDITAMISPLPFISCCNTSSSQVQTPDNCRPTDGNIWRCGVLPPAPLPYTIRTFVRRQLDFRKRATSKFGRLPQDSSGSAQTTLVCSVRRQTKRAKTPLHLEVSVFAEMPGF